MSRPSQQGVEKLLLLLTPISNTTSDVVQELKIKTQEKAIEL